MKVACTANCMYMTYKCFMFTAMAPYRENVKCLFALYDVMNAVSYEWSRESPFRLWMSSWLSSIACKKLSSFADNVGKWNCEQGRRVVGRGDGHAEKKKRLWYPLSHRAASKRNHCSWSWYLERVGDGVLPQSVASSLFAHLKRKEEFFGA